MVRPIQKHYGILKKVNPNTIVSTGFVVISCHKIDPHFVYVLLTQKEMTEYLDIIAEASTTTYPSLAPSDIAKIDFQMPPADLLQQFSKYTEHVWDKTEENNSQIRTLSKTRDTILPKLMSGEIRTKL
jgi:type I restriction enzyme S subunit